MTTSPAIQKLVGRHLRALRRKRRLTRSALAARVGLHVDDVSRMEQGEMKVSMDTLFEILRAVDAEGDELNRLLAIKG